MKKMMKNRKGFTLMEMLIVVAIIAILVIIAIPTFNSALAKARAATDVANIRSGYAAAQVEAVTNGLTDPTNGDKYVLEADGSVTKDKATKAYTTQGESSKAAAGSSIGGKFDVGATAAGTTIAWSKGQQITYVVKDADKDGVPEVTEIKPIGGTTTGGGAGQTNP